MQRRRNRLAERLYRCGERYWLALLLVVAIEGLSEAPGVAFYRPIRVDYETIVPTDKGVERASPWFEEGKDVYQQYVPAVGTESDSEGVRAASSVTTADYPDWRPADGQLVSYDMDMLIQAQQPDLKGLYRPQQRRRLCSVCNLLDASRGVAEEGASERWITLLCRHCAQIWPAGATISLSARCLECKRYATFGPYGGERRDVTHCKKHRLPNEVRAQQQAIKLPKCIYRHAGVSCTEDARWGDRNEKSPRFCSKHKFTDHVILATSSSSRAAAPTLPQHCSRAGCDLEAIQTEREENPLCAKHARKSQQQQEDAAGLRCRCEHKGCTRSASYGAIGDIIPKYCKSHRPPLAVSLRGPRCEHLFGCSKRPTFGEPGGGAAARFCAAHKSPHHVNVRARRCQAPGGACLKQPCFGASSDGVARFCSAHRRPGDSDLVHPRCTADKCTTTAWFGLPGHAPSSCVAHRGDGMVCLAAAAGRAGRSVYPVGGGRGGVGVGGSEMVGMGMSERERSRSLSVSSSMGSSSSWGTGLSLVSS